MTDKKKKLTLKCCSLDMSGYASFSRAIALELYQYTDIDIVIEPLRWINSGNLPLPSEEVRIIRELEAKHLTEEYRRNISEYTLIHFSIAPEFQRAYPQHRTFGYTMLETNVIPQEWVLKCNNMDGVFVPSYFNLSSFVKSGVKVPIRTVPLGIDYSLYDREQEPLYSKDIIKTKLNFIIVGQWTPSDRKNIEKTLRLFFSIFKNDRDVGLIMKVHGTGAGTMDRMAVTEAIQLIRSKMGFKENEGPQIYLVHGALPPKDMARLYKNADVFILPSYGEAWGMPIMEAAVSGLPIITTGGTGAEMFLNPDSSLMLSYKADAVPKTMYWKGVYGPNQDITVPDWEEFGKFLQQLRDPKLLAIAKQAATEQVQELKQRDFSWKKTVQTLLYSLKELGGLD